MSFFYLAALMFGGLIILLFVLSARHAEKHKKEMRVPPVEKDDVRVPIIKPGSVRRPPPKWYKTEDGNFFPDEPIP